MQNMEAAVALHTVKRFFEIIFIGDKLSYVIWLM